MAIETTTFILPAAWASGLINDDWSGLDYSDDPEWIAAEEEAISAALADLASEGWEIMDVVRDDDGEPCEPWFTWSYGLYGGTASGGDVLEYVASRRLAP